MKACFKILIGLCLLAGNVSAQDDLKIYVGLNTGAGPTVEWLTLKNVASTDDMGNPILIAQYKIRYLGYHIPVWVPIQFGRKHWRAGVDLGYEYLHITKVHTPESFGTAGTTYETLPLDLSYHLFKFGGNFEYDVWHKNKNAINISLRVGYYAVLKYTYGKIYMAPFMYGSAGLHASRDLSQGFQLVYGIDLGAQGYTYSLPAFTPQKAPAIFFQPEIVVGFKKSFGISHKSKK